MDLKRETHSLGGLEATAASSTASASAEQKPLHYKKLPDILHAPDVSNYMDFRKLLSDFYQYRRDMTKRDLRPYNYAMFSAAANIKSPNYLKMIIEGKRNLSEEMISKFAKAMGFNKEMGEEFQLLVLFNQATDPADRNILLKQLSEFRVSSQLKNGMIDKKTWEKVPNWVTWILFAMLDQDGVTFNTEQLRELLRGKATSDEIESALKTLITSGEVTKDAETGLLKKGTVTEPQDEIPVALVRKIQSQLMYLGLESLFSDGPTEREFGSVTLTLTKSEFEDIRFQLRKLRKQIHKDNSIARMSTKGERVYQLNLQLFPVTDRAEA